MWHELLKQIHTPGMAAMPRQSAKKRAPGMCAIFTRYRADHLSRPSRSSPGMAHIPDGDNFSVKSCSLFSRVRAKCLPLQQENECGKI